MVAKVISIIFYIIAALYFFAISMIAFINGRYVATMGEISDIGDFFFLFKAIAAGFSFVIAAIALLIGLAITRFKNAMRDIGIVLLCSAGYTAFGVLTAICMYMDKEAMKMFPINHIDLKMCFSDYVTGFSSMIIMGLAGVLLLRSAKKSIMKAKDNIQF